MMALEATITSIQQLTPDVKEFVLEADEHVFEYEPGHHVRIHYEQNAEGIGMSRPYTATSLPGMDELTVAIKHYEGGAASTYMHERESGDVIRIEEPAGGFSLCDLDTDVVFIASGTGVTPMVAMLKQYLEEGTGEAHLFSASGIEITSSIVLYSIDSPLSTNVCQSPIRSLIQSMTGMVPLETFKITSKMISQRSMTRTFMSPECRQW